MGNDQLSRLSSSGDEWGIISAGLPNEPSAAPLKETEKKGRMGAITITPVKIDKSKAKLTKRVQAQWNRLVYFVKNLGYDSLRGIKQSYVLQHKHPDVKIFGDDPGNPNVRIGSEDITSLSGIGPHLLAKPKEGEQRFLQFELATMHGGLWQELHNISVLVDRESNPPRIYVLDGKGQNPEEAYLTERRPGAEVKTDKTVQDFINLLTQDGENSIEAEVAYIHTPLQRRMDCVIFPLVVRDQLIKQTQEGSSTSAKEVLETTLNTCLENPHIFYKAINALRDQYLDFLRRNA